MQREEFFHALDTVIQAPRKITVLSHVNPDGDAIGSSLAFSQFLQKLGHEVEVMVSNDFPEFLAWMPGASRIHIYDKESDICDQILESSDLIAILDFNHISRAGLIQDKLKSLKINKILIDHHRDTDFDVFLCALSDTQVSSTSELVAETILHYGEHFVDESIATNILVGIVTDTGSFSHSIYHPETFSICAKMIEKSISRSFIYCICLIPRCFSLFLTFLLKKKELRFCIKIEYILARFAPKISVNLLFPITAISLGSSSILLAISRKGFFNGFNANLSIIVISSSVKA